MFNPKYLVIASVQATKNNFDLVNKLKKIPGDWDVINLDGSLTSIDNPKNNETICDENIIRLAYVKQVKEADRDNRTYKQVDSMEAYVKYHILKNPFLYISDANNFSEMEMGFDIDDIYAEFGISKNNLLYRVKL